MTERPPLAVTGDLSHYPAPPELGGALTVTQWLRSMAEADDKKKAHARAREARAIADWLTRLGRWLHWQAFEPAQGMSVGTAETLQAAQGDSPPARSRSDAPISDHDSSTAEPAAELHSPRDNKASGEGIE